MFMELKWVVREVSVNSKLRFRYKFKIVRQLAPRGGPERKQITEERSAKSRQPREVKVEGQYDGMKRWESRDVIAYL